MILRELLEKAELFYTELSQEFEEDIEVEEFFKDKEEMKAFISMQQELLLECIQAFYTHAAFPKQECIGFYETSSLPYVLLIKYLDKLEEKLKRYFINSVQTLKSAQTGNVIFQIESVFLFLKNLIAQVYLYTECRTIAFSSSSKFLTFPLFSSHIRWREKIKHAILSDQPEQFPESDAHNCDYAKAMEYPESIMVCMDEKLCKKVDSLHELLHHKAVLLRRHLQQRKYTSAYLVFKTLMEYSYKFDSLLKDLYYATYSDLENSFFKLIDMLSYKQTEQTLSILDITGIRQLNSLHGEEAIDTLLEQIQSDIEATVSINAKHILFIRATSANFYILHLDIDRKKVQEELHRMCQNINKSLREHFPHISVELSLASFALDRNIHYQKDELVRIMLHIKEQAKERKERRFIYEQKEIEEIRKWLNERYFNINFIREKIHHKEVDVVFQPIFSIDTKKLFALEALARIKDGKRLLPAGMFIDTVYDIGLVSELDKLVLDAILEKQENILSLGAKIFINSSAQSLVDPGYITHLNNFLTNFQANDVIVEITEQQALKSMEIIKKIHKEYGIQFAIDDFGSGYSALKTVSDLAEEGLVSVLKIDGSLICNMDKESQTQKIVKVITKMCDTFEIDSLAEFIENENTLDLLKEFGTNLAQGYFLSKPLTIQELQNL